MNPKLPEIYYKGTTAELKKQDLLKNLAEALGIETSAAKLFLEIALENVLLMDAKQKDYGSANIRKGGTFGCVLRSSDKFERLFNLFQNKKRKAVNESIIDSFRDISNYMNIAIMLEKGQWPNE